MHKVPVGASKKLARLKEKALKFATGIVRKVWLDSFTAAYAYFHWRSDTAVDVDILGLVPSSKVKDLQYWKRTCKKDIDELLDQARELVWDTEGAQSWEIEQLCTTFDKLACEIWASNKEYNQAFSLFFETLDDETKKDRQALERKYRELIKRAGGIWTMGKGRLYSPYTC